jgi:type II secretory ATPase GspE/PulE/Tfp pilus assembly ATPase PilB-like protein/ActR/RegA family two-component response regulator
MDRVGAGPHWLVDAVRRTDLANADTVALAEGIANSDAWIAVAAHCGVSVDDLVQEVADRLRLPVARLDRRDPHVAKLVPEKLARRFRVVALRESDRQIVIATDDPLNDEIERAVAFAAGRMPLFELATPLAIDAELEAMFAPPPAPAAVAAKPAGGTVEAASDEAVQLVHRSSAQIGIDDGDSAPVVKLTNLILRNAAHERASDIHLEPQAGSGTVRFRVDGVMHVHMRMPLVALSRVVARIKIMGALDIADRLRPQDGRSSFEVDGTSIDLRISTVPTRDAEKCVIRLLRGGASDKLADLKLGERDLRAMKSLVGHRNGVVIVTGPTGSGKTTTLYACIRELNNGETNISTVEDPIEYEIAGITQMQVEVKRDFTFATALRAILRQDPDVILVGEIRDSETAAIAVQASMTGHLVLSTLHTNDAAGVIARLADIGVERPAIASTLRGVVAQRLMRRACPHCAEKVTSPNADEQRLARLYGVQPSVRSPGCARCNQSGYLGRLAILEILAMSPGLQELVSRGASSAELQKAAVAAGMRTLRASALQRVMDGETTLQEVERVIGEAGEEVAVAAPAPREGAPRVLVVEDDRVCRKVALKQLAESEFDAVECASGEDALERLKVDDRIGLVVLDLGLPGMQGDEVLRVMRGSPATSSLPVIVLTGSPDPELEVRLMEEGADDYLRKPLEPRRFITRVRAALRRAAA